MNKVLYIGSGGFPFGNARSMRMRSFCALFAELGYEVDVISDWNSSSMHGGPWKCLSARSEDEYRNEALLNRFSRYYRDVEKALESAEYSFAFVTEMPERVSKIQSLCRKKNLPAIGDSCEWYDSSTWRYGLLDPHNILFQIAHRVWYTNWNGVVSISSLLDDYYKSKNVPSAIIPTILDTHESSVRLNCDAESRDINLLFAGSFGGSKDSVAPMVEAAADCAARFSDRKVVVNVLGPAVDQVRASLGGELYSTAVGCGVLKVLPRVSQEKVADYWRWADYGLFIRPIRRSSNAGFPTKLGEGFAVGTPFITNKTGDIPRYIEDGKNGLLLSSRSSEECSSVIERLLAFTDEEHELLRKAARQCAENYFDYRAYADRMRGLIVESGGGVAK